MRAAAAFLFARMLQNTYMCSILLYPALLTERVVHMLDLKRVLASAPRAHEPLEAAALLTPWGESLEADAVLREHPNPQFARASYTVLNGWWDYAIVPGVGEHAEASRAIRAARHALGEAHFPAVWDGRILVPFSPEAALSGVGRQLKPGELLWYRRSFELGRRVPGERCVLHFEGVDHACAVYVNDVLLGVHEGAYLPFSYDVTAALRPGENVLAVCVCDPADAGTQLRGKQRLQNGGIWYTAQSGIWQTVWYEVVPAARIEEVRLAGDPQTGALQVDAALSEPGANLCVRVFDAEGREVASSSCYVPRSENSVQPVAVERPGARAKEAFLPEATCHVGCLITLEVPGVRPWSPADPYLYRLELRYGDDVVASYCAFRS